MRSGRVGCAEGLEVNEMSAEAAREYIARGWAPIPFERREKGPTYEGWQTYRANGCDEFANKNIGILDGVPSNGIVDVDLDCPEALALAPLVLPPTGAIFGRKSKPKSHWLYRCAPPPETKQFQFNKAMFVELRSTGVQTMVPPSVHPSGETVRWDSEDEPAVIEASELARHVSDLAALCLLARNWPDKHGRYNVVR